MEESSSSPSLSNDIIATSNNNSSSDSDQETTPAKVHNPSDATDAASTVSTTVAHRGIVGNAEADDDNSNDDDDTNSNNYTTNVNMIGIVPIEAVSTTTATAAATTAMEEKREEEEILASPEDTLSPTHDTITPQVNDQLTPIVANNMSDELLIKSSLVTMEQDEHQQHQQQQQQEVPLWRQDATSTLSNNNASLKLLSIPVDSLHCIASFLTATEWAKFGQTTSIATPICRDVFTRVRMHGFRCATEVVTAWKLGQHADARELAALYIQAGVPIYPLSLGHSYHTVVWRMGVEARDMEHKQAAVEQAINDAQQQQQQQDNNNDDDEADNAPRPIDPFFAERYDARAQQGDEIPNSTYLEEKCLFCYNKAAEKDSRLRIRVSMTSRTSFAPPAPVLGGMHAAATWDGRTRLPDFRPASPAQVRSSPTLAYSDASRIPPKVHVRLHRHLVDQHVLGGRAVDDEQGGMVAAPISLAADFFHQNVRDIMDSGDEQQQQQPEPPVPMLRAPLMPPSFSMTPSSSRFSLGARLDDRSTNINFGDNTMGPVGDTSRFVDSQVSGHESLAPPDLTPVASGDGSHSPVPGYGTPLQSVSTALLISPPPPPPPVPTPDELSSNEFPSRNEPSVLNGIDLEVYNSASTSIDSLSDPAEGVSELNSQLKTQFGVFQQRLETLLSQNDSSGVEECILDFWDEFLPVTANIHIHDRNTAIPRISGLQEFLSKPCPQAFGIVQCEIERIKVSSKRKGVNMKGRLFPSYEYRLFIRDRRHDASTAESAVDQREDTPARRDTVMMTAKNRGRKHQASNGVQPAPGASKKGVNNYYLYMPQQADVDTHYRSVNNNSGSATFMPNGASGDPSPRVAGDDSSVLLGRLQSNFIGTEFQIFTPTLQKHPVLGGRKPATARHPASSDSESDYEGASSDNTPTTPRRRNRFQRRRSNRELLRRSNRDNASERNTPQPISEEESVDGSPSSDRRRTKRAYSLPNFSYRRSTRNSRRAVANSVDPADSSQHYQPLLYEVEDGAITYTANLLGNRPRIMDVCVPKVSTVADPSTEWNRYLSSVDDSSEAASNSMLHHFRQLQQRLENPDQNIVAATAHENNNNNNNDGATNTGSNAIDENDEGDENNYTPPSDFGLLALQNRPPWWNVELGAFVLNFGGRVSVASVKNFQLCDRNDQDHIMLQFGRIQGRHSFTMDFQHPLTAVQAFAIAISSLQSRISFG